jgi:hypothetical protein
MTVKRRIENRRTGYRLRSVSATGVPAYSAVTERLLMYHLSCNRHEYRDIERANT